MCPSEGGQVSWLRPRLLSHSTWLCLIAAVTRIGLPTCFLGKDPGMFACVCVCVRERESVCVREREYICLLVNVCVCVCVCVCMYVREREREREREKIHVWV